MRKEGMIMPGKHEDTTIAFRPSEWARAVIEQRAALSGMYKKDFYYKKLCVLKYCCGRQKRKCTSDCRCAAGNANSYEGNCRADSVL